MCSPDVFIHSEVCSLGVCLQWSVFTDMCLCVYLSSLLTVECVLWMCLLYWVCSLEYVYVFPRCVYSQ